MDKREDVEARKQKLLESVVAEVKADVKPKAFEIELLTSDIEDESFAAYRFKNLIVHRLTGFIDKSGDFVVFRAATKEALVSMYKEFYCSGDEESDLEELANIKEVE